MAFSASQRVLLGTIAALFAIGTSVLSWDNARSDLAPRFHWPDEMTNAFFASRVAHGESLAVPEPRNQSVGNFIHPRTANVRGDGSVVPGSYLGLPLWYGMVGRIAGSRAMLFLTPILAAAALLAFASIVRRVAGATVAVFATVFLALHPSLWLFTATAMLPNVPFVALLLIGFFFLIRGGGHPTVRRDALPRGPSTTEWARFVSEGRESEGGKGVSERLGERTSLGESARPALWDVRNLLLGGFLLGLALTIRTHELLWVFAVVGALVWKLRAGWRQLLALACGIVVPFIPILILNAQLYGSPFTTGYALLQDGGAAPTEFARSFLPSWFVTFVAPFGWHPVDAFVRFWKYLIVPYWWFATLAVLGIVSSFSPFRAKRRTGAAGNAVTIALAVWLILYYGSWELADPLVRETNVLTISYVRYWLPIMVLLAPWAAGGLLAIAIRIPTRWRSYATALVFFGIAFTSFAQVVTDADEGLLRQRQALNEHRVRARAVIAATPPDAVIVSHRMDKVFFPERVVVHATVEDLHRRTFRERLAELSPFVYWYTVSSPSIPQLFVHDGNVQRWIPAVHLTPVGRAMPFGEHLYWLDGVQVSDD